MARRRRGGGWLSLWQDSMSSLARSALRTGQKAAAQGLKASLAAAAPRPRRARTGPAMPLTAAPSAAPARPARAAPRPAPAGRAGNAAPLRARQVVGPAGRRALWLALPAGGPARPRPRWPLLLMLHGCGQTALSFAASTRMHRLATREGCCVLYAEQDRHAHPQACWRWYDTRSGSAQAEAATLLAAVDRLIRDGTVDPRRVAVAGLSAGAGMAALLGSLYPGRFAAVVMHSGVAPGAAHSTATALSAMMGRRAPWLAPAGVQAAGAAEPWPALLVIQGLADRVVAASNGEAAAAAWAARAGAVAGTVRVLQRGGRHAMRLTDYRRRGRLRARLCEIEGLGHAWSGGAASQPYGDPLGPDATRLAWRFVAHQFSALPEAAFVPADSSA